MPPFEVTTGSPHPFGAVAQPDGVNFSLFSQDATGVILLLFLSASDIEPVAAIRFDPFVHKTFHFWHIFVRDVKPGMFYAFRVDGPNDPANGFRFNSNKVLVGPYARGISKQLWSRADACTPFDNLATSLRCCITDTSDYDWEGDRPLNRPIQEAIIYEMHVGGFTRSPSARASHPGTFAAVVEKIPYLQALGITAVELLPVFEFDDVSTSLNPEGQIVENFWGYSTISFFAPHSSYCIDRTGPDHVNEFRDMVKALHKAGIEVILDIVFNHTDEGSQQGPTFSFRGIDNRTYYILDPNDRAHYMNFSGVGNTFNCNHPIPQKFIIDCVSYWVNELHVDGFRFDEGSILTRGEDGLPMVHPPVVWQVELDDLLANTKLIAEAWDAAGLYQIGHFPGDRWAQWNGRFRDDIRRFVRGEPGLTGAVAYRIGGSSDTFEGRSQTPENSINFVTCHDGFTLNDLVSYNQKHNEANGEGNRDGMDENLSWNCGAEGPSDDPAVVRLRARQVRNFATILMLSRGVPMLLGGDELSRTQLGNNNAYNQNNEISWFDWTFAEKHAGLLRFFQRLIAFRKAHRRLTRPRFYTGRTNERGMNDITWHGTQLDSPGFDDTQSRALAFTIAGFGEEADLHVMMNMFWEPLAFAVPVNPSRQWRVAIDTAQSSPHDIAEEFAEPEFDGHVYLVQDRSIVVLLARQPT